MQTHTKKINKQRTHGHNHITNQMQRVQSKTKELFTVLIRAQESLWEKKRDRQRGGGQDRPQDRRKRAWMRGGHESFGGPIEQLGFNVERCVCVCGWVRTDGKPLAEAAGRHWRTACQLQERRKRRAQTSHSVSSWEARWRLRWGRRHWSRSHSGKKSPTLGVGTTGGWRVVALIRTMQLSSLKVPYYTGLELRFLFFISDSRGATMHDRLCKQL